MVMGSQNNDASSDANFQFSINQGGVTTVMMSLDKTTGLDLQRNLSVRPLGTAAGDRYFDVNAPSGFSISATLLELLSNSSSRFQVKTTGQTTITKTGNTAGVPLSVIAETGQTGDLLDMQVGANPAFNVDSTGLLQTYGSNAWTTYTPTVTNGGTATFTTRTGWWRNIGDSVQFTAYVVINAAGSGASAVAITAPSSIDRTTRQTIPAHCDGTAVQGTFSALCLTGGTGATIDRLRSSTNANLTGADLSAGSIITVSGSYRQG
jgi:hypothetical protein